MKNWDHSIHQHVLVYQGEELELFCFIFVKVITKFMGSLFLWGEGHPVLFDCFLIFNVLPGNKQLFHCLSKEIIFTPFFTFSFFIKFCFFPNIFT